MEVANGLEVTPATIPLLGRVTLETVPAVARVFADTGRTRHTRCYPGTTKPMFVFQQKSFGYNVLATDRFLPTAVTSCSGRGPGRGRGTTLLLATLVASGVLGCSSAAKSNAVDAASGVDPAAAPAP